MRLRFITFDLDCDNSSIDIYNGNNNTGVPMLADLCGSSLPADVISSGNTLLVVFHASGSGTQSNFWVKYSETVKGN